MTIPFAAISISFFQKYLHFLVSEEHYRINQGVFSEKGIHDAFMSVFRRYYSQETSTMSAFVYYFVCARGEEQITETSEAKLAHQRVCSRLHRPVV